MKKVISIMLSILLFISVSLTITITCFYETFTYEKIVEMMKESYFTVKEDKVISGNIVGANIERMSLSKEEIKEKIENSGIDSSKVKDSLEDLKDIDIQLSQEEIKELLQDEKVQEMLEGVKEEVKDYVEGDKSLDQKEIEEKITEVLDIVEEKTGKTLEKEKILKKVGEMTKVVENTLDKVKENKLFQGLTYLLSHRIILNILIVIDCIIIGLLFLTNRKIITSFVYTFIPIGLSGLIFSQVESLVNLIHPQKEILPLIDLIVSPFTKYGNILMIISIVALLLLLIIKIILTIRQKNKNFEELENKEAHEIEELK